MLLAFVALPGIPIAERSAGGQSAAARGVIRLRVKPKVAGQTKSLARKRFFLIKGSLAQHKSLIDAIESTRVLARACYYRNIGASDALIEWLKVHDCESVYCREVERQDLAGDRAVPEFKVAYTRGEKEFANSEVALGWLTANLSEEIRSGFYRRQQTAIRALLKQAEENSKASVMSVMTDRNGTAYFTDLEPGAYLVTNLIPTEFGDNSLLWTCEMNVKPGELATERPYTLSTLSNPKDKQVKCVAVEKPLPACERTSP